MTDAERELDETLARIRKLQLDEALARIRELEREVRFLRGRLGDVEAPNPAALLSRLPNRPVSKDHRIGDEESGETD